MGRKHLVTGGTGFIGAALVRRLIKEGHSVRVLDNQSRGATRRLADVEGKFSLIEGDIRDAKVVENAVMGVDCVWHLAFVNGTEFFYTKPELVLDVGVKGMVNVLDACLNGTVPELIVASSSEVYQTPVVIPTTESVPMMIPDPLNPRYSYAAGKIISEIMSINYGRKYFKRTLIFRPHNVYGPDMGWEHVIPQFIKRMQDLVEKSRGPVRFPIQGTGEQTRSFIFIDDFIEGLMVVMERGENLGIYNIGTMDEITIADLVRMVGKYFERQVETIPGEPAKGGTLRRCPDTSKLIALGFKPVVSLKEGLERTAEWYIENER